jgi:hypothetical protein
MEVIATSAMRMYVDEAGHNDHTLRIDVSTRLRDAMMGVLTVLTFNSFDARAIDDYGAARDVCCGINEASIP